MFYDGLNLFCNSGFVLTAGNLCPKRRPEKKSAACGGTMEIAAPISKPQIAPHIAASGEHGKANMRAVMKNIMVKVTRRIVQTVVRKNPFENNQRKSTGRKRKPS